MPSITDPILWPKRTRNFITTIRASHLTGVTFTLIPKGDGHGLDASATLATPGEPRIFNLGIRHEPDGQLRAFYGTSPDDTIPEVDHALMGSIRTALDKIDRLRTEAEALYRSLMQETAIRLAAEFTERLMAAQAAGDTTFDVLAELPRDQLATEGLRAVEALNALAARNS